EDPLQIKNYRPIALTDTLYKIFTRIMTERVEKVVEKYGMVADEQQGFRSDRSCLSASMALKILMARRMKKGQEKPFHVAYLDISKAYDTVDHEKLWEILGGMGIRGNWLENMKKLYKDNVLKSMLPSGKTRGVPMRRGIRQGCPLSPILFAMYVEPITRMMKKVNPRKDEEPSM
ncbi:MAG: reverse transcriptase family protein, partial [Desulfobacteraceae bacterium]|nr:reverse transcriptase family protein [Desulfobacteraceae bacterium]